MKKFYILLVTLLVTTMSFGQIMITELADPNNNAGARFIELYNMGSTSVNFSDGSGWKIDKYRNGESTINSTLNLTGIIPPDGFYIIGYDSTSGTFATVYGFAPDQLDDVTDGVTGSNGDDDLVLIDGTGATIDTWGEVGGIDNSNTCAEYEDGRAERKAGITTSSATWDESEWNVWSDGSSASGCTTHNSNMPQSAPNDFDPGAWIGQPVSNTTVSFITSSSDTTEDVGTIDVCVSITNPSASAATTVDIDLNVGGSSASDGVDFTSIATTTLTFPMGSSDDQCLTITITDDSEVEIPENIILNLQNVSGGDTALLGANIEHTLVITANDYATPTVGAIIVSEIMQNPTTVQDSFGEYFEVYNTTGAAIDMQAWNITDDGGQLHYIGSSLIVPANGYMILGANTDTSTNGNVPVDYAYGSEIGFSNGDDEVILSAGSTEIDRVAYNDSDFPDGSNIESGSMSLNVNNLNSTDNDDGANWCIAISEIGTAGNLDNGTPGTTNDDCSTACGIILTTISITCDSNTSGDDNDTVTIHIPYVGVGADITSVTTSAVGATISGDDPATVTDGTISITGLSEGDAWNFTINGGNCDGTTDSGTVSSTHCDPSPLVINEILYDPANSVEDGDANGDGVRDGIHDEFVEIYNTSSSSVDLEGYTISDAVMVRHTFTSTVLAGNSFITIFGGGTPTGINGMTQVATTESLGLNNGGDSVILKNATGSVIQTYAYSNGNINASICREPDFSGAFVEHTAHTSNPQNFTPGDRNDGVTASVSSNTIEGFSIYPNPANKGSINITTLNKKAKNVKIFSILGKKVLENSFSNANFSINVSNLNKGLYILKVTEGNNTSIEKVILK